MQALFKTPALVRGIYLPVGNPETQWLYGLTHQGFALKVVSSPALLAEHLVFVSVYNRASIPVLSSITATEPEETLPPCPVDGFFAMRLVRKDGGTTAEAAKAEVAITLVRVESATKTE